MTSENKIIDGKSIAENLRKGISRQTTMLKALNIIPGLAVIQVGHNPSSTIYITNKI